MSGDAGEEEALVFMLTSWSLSVANRTWTLVSRGKLQSHPPRLLLTWTPLALYCFTVVLWGKAASVKLPSVRPLIKLLYLTRSVWRCLFYISVVCFNINMKKWNYFDQKIVSISYFFRRADNDLPLSEAKMEVIRRCYSAKKTRSGFPLIMAVIFPLMHLV